MKILQRAICGLILIVGVLAASVGTDADEPVKHIRIIYSNDTLGYIEPCGCGGKNEGGLARRASHIEKLVKENPNVVIVESGNIANMPDKMEFITDILSQLHYDALGIGDTDINANAEEFFKQTTAHKLTVVDAVLEKTRSTKPYIIKNVDGVRVGIVSFGVLPPNSKIPDLDISKLRLSAYKAARDASDILIVLDQANLVTPEWLENNKGKLGSPDIVICGVYKSTELSDTVVGQTHLVPTSSLGKHVGVVDIEFTKGKPAKYDVRKLSVDESIPEDPNIAKQAKELMNKVQRSFATDIAAQSEAAKSMETVMSKMPPSNSAKPYYSTQSCKRCHAEEYDNWAKTKHAHAVKTLVDADRTIPECLICHSELYRSNQMVSTTSTDTAGVECATCHAASLPHGMERKQVTQKTTVDKNMCLSCHTKERSPNYNEESYYPRVMHTKGN